MSKDYEEWVPKYFEQIEKSQGYKKLWNYFTDITKTIYFRKKIDELKKKYDIPLEGFDKSKGMIIPPQEWKYKHTKKQNEYGEDVKKICQEYNLHFLFWSTNIDFLVFYNELSNVADDGYDLCLFTDLKEESMEPFSKDTQDADNAYFPLAIRISPFATQRDIIDYIKKHFIVLKKWQEMYLKDLKQGNVGKIRKKKESIQKRNDFIYENRKLPRKKIMELVADKFKEYLDYGHIGKIISLEKNKRENK